MQEADWTESCNMENGSLLQTEVQLFRCPWSMGMHCPGGVHSHGCSVKVWRDVACSGPVAGCLG